MHITGSLCPYSERKNYTLKEKNINNACLSIKYSYNLFHVDIKYKSKLQY
jgi:hypothetical protein